MPAAPNSTITLCLICRSMPDTPASEGVLDIGIQDKAQAVHAGRVAPDGAVHFTCSVEARIDARGLDFRGPFVQGTPQGRFLYLSWKRRDVSEAPWYWRVKVPLAGITARDLEMLKAGESLTADITGRRPHATQAIEWRVGVS